VLLVKKTTSFLPNLPETNSFGWLGIRASVNTSSPSCQAQQKTPAEEGAQQKHGNTQCSQDRLVEQKTFY